jgi:hypothetical protein
MPPPAPGIIQLINDMESDFYDSALQLEGFASYIRAGKAPEALTREGYNASIWTLLGEAAIEAGEKLTLPEKYII